MKNATFLFLCFMLLSGCKNEAPNPPSLTKRSITTKKHSKAKVIIFDCDLFFKKGDYSSLCFTDVELLQPISAGCIFDFQTKGNKHEESLKAQFVLKSSSALAEMHLNLKKGNYKKGKIIDIPNLGDQAFFDLHNENLKSLSRNNKDLYVRFKNISITIMASHLSRNESPCFINDIELIAFAEKILKHL